MRILTTGVAALALVATGALAQGNGNGNGKGQGAKDRGGPPAKVERGGGKPDKARADRGGPPAVRAAERRGPEKVRGNNGNGNAQGAVAGTRGGPDLRGGERRGGPDLRDRDLGIFGVFADDRSRGLVDGCPPGLAKKNNGCMPPGQAKKRSPWGSAYQPSLFGLSNYRSGNYFYDDGYLVRLGNNGGISGYIPLLGGALAIGNPWPAQYQSYGVPDYYVDFYGLNGPNSYRYADNVIYRVDAETAAIQSVAALLTGNDITIGQPMPRGYDVYNVPYAYRDRYYDTPDAYYRYSDGYVYRIDPETQLVAAAIDLLI